MDKNTGHLLCLNCIRKIYEINIKGFCKTELFFIAKIDFLYYMYYTKNKETKKIIFQRNIFKNSI